MFFPPKRYLAIALIGIAASYTLVPAASAQEQSTEALKAQKEKLELEVQVAELNDRLENAKKHRTADGKRTGLGVYTPDVARVETFVGIEYLRVNPQAGISALIAKGIKGELILNFTNALAIVSEFGASHDAHLAGFAGNASSYVVMVGPRLSSRRFGRMVPYIQGNVGAVLSRGDRTLTGATLPVAGGTVTVPTTRLAKAALATTVGVGIDIRVMHMLSIRPVAIDYFMSRIDGLREPGDIQQNGLRYTAGAAIRWGKR